VSKQLSIIETVRLVELEQTIERGLQTFIEVGEALREIRDSRLYLERYDTFEDYLRERWSGMSRSRAHRLIDAADVVEMLPIGNTPANEAQARELVPLLDTPDELADVMRELQAEHGDRLTAAKVRTAVEQRLQLEQRIGTVTSSGGVEWYTPSVYVDAAREVLGGIDLDPASSATANATVRAQAFFDATADGLARPWSGRVYMNPPYGRDCPKFVARLLDAHAAGQVPAAIALLSAYSVDTGWFQPLYDHLLCFVAGRISFDSPVYDHDRPSSGSVFVYLGPDRERFVDVFGRFGAVLERRHRNGVTA
jgi:hypothetical protein